MDIFTYPGYNLILTDKSLCCYYPKFEQIKKILKETDHVTEIEENLFSFDYAPSVSVDSIIEKKWEIEFNDIPSSIELQKAHSILLKYNKKE